MYTQLYTNFSKIYTRLYTNFPKMHTRSYTNCKNCENRYRSLYQNHENRYRSLYQNREKRYPSRWHVPVPKLCVVPPRGDRGGLWYRYQLIRYQVPPKLKVLVPPILGEGAIMNMTNSGRRSTSVPRETNGQYQTTPEHIPNHS